MEFTSFVTLIKGEVEKNLQTSRTGEKYIVRINDYRFYSADGGGFGD